MFVFDLKYILAVFLTQTSTNTYRHAHSDKAVHVQGLPFNIQYINKCVLLQLITFDHGTGNQQRLLIIVGPITCKTELTYVLGSNCSRLAQYVLDISHLTMPYSTKQSNKWTVVNQQWSQLSDGLTSHPSEWGSQSLQEHLSVLT